MKPLNTLPDIGKTWYGDQTINASNYGQSEGVEGSEMYVKDYEAVRSGQIRTTRSNRMRLAIFVRNTSGGALLPGAAVKWEAEYRGRRVNATAADQGETAGFVDDSLPAAGVKDDDCFWLIVDGPVLAKKATGSSTAIAADVVLISGGTYLVKAVTAAANDAGVQATCLNACGRVIKAALDADARVLIDARCRR
jgi:hypothetical protein